MKKEYFKNISFTNFKYSCEEIAKITITFQLN